MIRSICLNPLLDRSYYISNFVPGKKYKNNIPRECIGGKGINIAKVCSQLGEPAAIYGFLGGKIGRQIFNGMKGYCDWLRFVDIAGENRITVNIIDRTANLETEIVEQGPAANSAQIDQLMAYLKQDLNQGDIVICSGISITGAPDDIYVQISHLCSEYGAICCLDTNGEILKHSLKGSYYLGKPNHHELAELNGSEPVCDPLLIRDKAAGLIEKSFKYLLVSTGEQGAVLCGKEDCFKALIPAVNVVSTIGSGDSALAGFAVGLAREMPIIDTLILSMACGVANSMTADVARIEIEQIAILQDKIRIEKL